MRYCYLREKLLVGANIEVSGSGASVQCALEKKVLNSNSAIAGVTIGRGFSAQQVRTSQVNVTHSVTPDDGVFPICSF